MRSGRPSSKDVDDYIAGFPPAVQYRLQQIRKVIREAAPQAQETISYQIPAFTLHGNLIFFAGYKNHIGIYPAPRGVAEFEQELAAYKGGKGTLKIPLDQPIPFDLIKRIVAFRVKQNLERAAAKKKGS